MILVDTTVWIDLFGARITPQVKKLESLVDSREDLCLCGIVLTEVLQGIRDDKEHTRVQSVLYDLLYLPMTRETFLSASNIYRALRKKGVTLRNSVDCMIAAVCIENDIPLLHNDMDFDRIANQIDLQIVAVV